MDYYLRWSIQKILSLSLEEAPFLNILAVVMHNQL